MALTAPKVNCVDFCHDSAITKQALMALTAPKNENLGNFGLKILGILGNRGQETFGLLFIVYRLRFTVN